MQDVAVTNSDTATDALPFLEDTITHLVGREQVALSRRHKVPKSRVRAQAVRHALLGHGMGSDDALAWKDNRERRSGNRDNIAIRNNDKDTTNTIGEMSSLVQQANAIIAVISSIEQKLPLTLDQRLRISHAMVDSFAYESDNKGLAELKVANVFTPASAWQAISFLMSDCLLSQEEAAEVLANTPLIATTRMTENDSLRLRSVIDCLRLLEIEEGSVTEIVTSYPEILFGDVDQDMLPMLAYLSDLGLRELDMANIVKQYPQIFERKRKTKLQSGVAFWVGKGLSKASILKLIRADPGVLDINKRVMQVKVDWLLEHTEVSIEEFVDIPIALSENLGAFTAPRVAFAREKGWSISSAKQQMETLNGPTHSNEEKNRGVSLTTVLIRDVALFLQAMDANAQEFDEFVRIWYQKEFIPWLERKNKSSEILLQMENEFADSKMQERGLEENIAMQKELAWEQQQEREREWHLAWQEWKRGQENMLVAERAAKRIEKKNQFDLLRNHRDLLSREDRDDIFRQSLVSGANNCIKSPLCSREFGHSGICNRQLGNEFEISGGPGLENVDLFWDSRLPEKAIGDSAVSFFGRTWACDSTIEQALTQAINDSREMKEPKEDTNADEIPIQSIERVQSCAINLLLLLKASDYGVLEPIIFHAWAERSGVTRAELAAAKALISKTKSAFVQPEPSWKYYKVPSRVWMLPDAHLYAPGLLPLRLKTKGSQSVSKLADTIYECMLNSPHQALTRREIADMCSNEMDAQSKKVRFAVAMLLEQGLVAQRRRKGITSGPMELLLVDISRYEDYIAHSI